MQFDAMGRPMANIPVTEEGLNARGGYVGTIWHSPPNVTR